MVQSTHVTVPSKKEHLVDASTKRRWWPLYNRPLLYISRPCFYTLVFLKKREERERGKKRRAKAKGGGIHTKGAGQVVI